MRKKKYICLGLFFIAALAILSGCTKPTKGEKEIIEDLQADPAFISENTTISSYEIIKRRTDTDNKQDWVYVNVQSNDPDLTYSLSYELLYELYDNGWILEGVSRYYDGPWEFSGLGYRQVFDAVKEYDPIVQKMGTDDELRIFTTYDIIDEEYTSNTHTFYEKCYEISLKNSEFPRYDYCTTYRLFYEISNGIWELQNVEILDSKYVPYEPPDVDVQAVNDIMDKLGYKTYQYSHTDEDLENSFATVYYTATKTVNSVKNTYEVAIPLSYGLNGEDSPMWIYDLNLIEERRISP